MNHSHGLDRSSLLYYAGRTILDAPTHRYYSCAEGGNAGECQELAAGNEVASEWYFTLHLSELLEGEADPPDGHVGQYGRYGCVLSQTFHGVLDAATDIVLFPYERDDLERFLWELRETTGARFREAEVDPLTVNELHLLSLVDPWAEDDEETGEPRVPGQRIHVETDYGLEWEVSADVYGALAWGRAHAERLLERAE